jgi:hypothetical protein
LAAAKLKAHVIISVDYPEVAPLFVIFIEWQSLRTANSDICVKVSVHV